MSSIQIADETFVAAPAARVAEVIADRGNWSRWWPDLRLSVTEDRGESGIRWRVSGGVDGTMEFWLSPRLDGVVVHYFLHGEPAESLPDVGRARWDRVAAIVRTRRVAGRGAVFEVKRCVELGRAAGEPAVPSHTQPDEHTLESDARV
ncbi:hypothetical protein GCM10027169_09750 [Gordonia jinhuaensis]|uniref:Polyketide cyclase / dehydrase and lipid transport n=1 Tax=Gordonia jinhuaensis TaxID=1517702 RepID=A0A916WP22_9ACTN|nr:SRPBCC family protein [Gordonia jinhuaensis]GGB19022.1 hypothetical protein GCM10011489_03910 [Gordonia jinhuaensis]